MSWKQFIEGALGVISLYSFFGMLCRRVNAKIGSKAENELVKNMRTVLAEYEQQGLLDAKTTEQAEITEMQRKFNEKWGLMESGCVSHTH